nr:hypothetical protein [Tanacetum cinerariifolium]
MKNNSNRCERPITKLVKFIRAHQPVFVVLVYIDNSLRIAVCSVWSSVGDVRPECLWLGDIELLLVAFDSQLKIFYPFKNDNMSGNHLKPKRVKDSAYHKEKLLLCKQAEKGIDSEPLEHVQYNDEYNVSANVNQHCEQSKSTSNTCLVEKDDSDVTPDSPDINKGKEIAKPITPPSESASEEDSELEQAQRDKDMQKNWAIIAKYFKKIYKPANNNLKTSLNSRNKNVDTTSRYKNDNQSGQFRNQRAVNVAGARENVGSPVAQQTEIQCFNYKEFGHFAKECRKPKRVKDSAKPKRVKDSAYHKEKLLLCKQAEKGVSLQAEQSDWLSDTDEDIDEQELEAHYSYMAKI